MLLAFIAVLVVLYIPKDTNSNFTIVDGTVGTNIECAEVLEEFYEDDTYEYYFSCAKSNLVIVKYENGKEETVSEALKNGNITISDLDQFGINYIKVNK